jgi:CheY-like chemotaxis protein
LTANAFLEDVKKSKEAGMDEHLSKPVDIAALEQTVKRFRVIPPIINSGLARFRR